MLISLTVGKVDAGVAVLLTQDKRLIEFPSILLPPNITSGSIVDITVARNQKSEAKSQANFLALQDSIFHSFGASEPTTPVLRCRNATQTSVVLEWDPIESATADVISLSLFRNGQKAGNIPKPLENSSTKISGLGVDSEYTFYLLLRTTAGTFTSDKVVVRTHKMTDLSGITITPGILPAQLRESLTKAVERIGAKLADSVRIDTTHFVTTEARGLAWERAVEQNVPVVRPEWVEGCERGGRIMGVRGYYLDADPRLRQIPQGIGAAPQEAARPEATQTQTQTQTTIKDSELPERPKENGTSEESAAAPTPLPKEDEKTEEEENDEKDEKKEDGEEEEEDEDEVKEEPKSRVEDREEQKVAIPPTESEPEPEPEPENKSSDTLSPEGEKEDKEDGSKTPGSASFQDVAL